MTIAPPIAAATVPGPAIPSYAAGGADTCLACHSDEHVAAILKTRHGVVADARTPFAQSQCEACHGPGGEHIKSPPPGAARTPIPLFGSHSPGTVPQQNSACLACHRDSHLAGWTGSVHQREDLSCTNCHRLHVERDPVLQVTTQAEVCYTCHRVQRADFGKFSTHPVREGAMSCTACHAPHDSLFPALLNRPTVNQTCATCHAEKRGPFLWEHAPAAEDCGNCHVPHGSVNPALLVAREPLLCQQCHSPIGHPSVAYTGAALGSSDAAGFVQAGSCSNCHAHVHGSNAPSGADLTR